MSGPVRPRGGLGRGLEALLGAAGDLQEAAPGSAPRDTLVRLRVEQLRPNPEQPREVFDERALEGLARSLKSAGVLLPLVARRDEEGGYVLIAGERRWRAARLAGLEDVPVVVKATSPSDVEQLELALVENLQREDLDPLECAAGYQRLIQQHGYTQEQVAERVGKDRATVANALRLLKLPPSGREALRAGRISAGHARALVVVEDPVVFAETLARVLAKELSVRATEALVREMLAARPPSTAPRGPVTLERSWERARDQVVRAIGSKVDLKPRANGSGRMIIEWHDRDDFERLVAILRGA
jgi:ParB family chromosome partitioning protein